MMTGYQPSKCSHCGKDYLASPGFPLRFTCRGCAAEGKTEPSRKRRSRAGRSGRERREAQAVNAA